MSAPPPDKLIVGFDAVFVVKALEPLRPTNRIFVGQFFFENDVNINVNIGIKLWKCFQPPF